MADEPAYMLAARNAVTYRQTSTPTVVRELLARIDRDAATLKALADTSEHTKEAERMLRGSNQLRRAASNPDAGGPVLRKEWADEADRLLSEANVHATLAMAKRGQS